MMLRTYKAILKGDRLEWSGDAPVLPGPEHTVHVHVTLLDEPAPSEHSRGRRMAEALEQLAAIDAVRTIEDPEGWEREIRQDRGLPGRDT